MIVATILSQRIFILFYRNQLLIQLKFLIIINKHDSENSREWLSFIYDKPIRSSSPLHNVNEIYHSTCIHILYTSESPYNKLAHIPIYMHLEIKSNTKVKNHSLWPLQNAVYNSNNNINALVISLIVSSRIRFKAI